MFGQKVSISADVFSQSVVNSSKIGQSWRVLGRLNWLKHKKAGLKKCTQADQPDAVDPVVKPGRPNHTNRACFPDDVSIHKANSLKLGPTLHTAEAAEAAEAAA